MDTHQDEYDENMTTLLELFWGRGFMAPGGEGNVHRIVDGLELEGKTVLEIGSGIGGGALTLAGQYGAHVIGLEVEAPLVDQARKYACEDGLNDRIDFRLVTPGQLCVDDTSVDVVYISGVIIHIEDKPAVFDDVIRVLKPGGVMTGYDWFKGPGPLSPDMYEWIRLEELTFFLDTLDNYAEMMKNRGFEFVNTTDASSWYRAEAKRELELMQGPMYNKVGAMLGNEKRDHFIADWTAMIKVLDSGEARSGYFRGYKSA